MQYDYDINVNFARLKTYDWLPIHEEADISSLDIKRIRNSVNSQLKTKGLKITSDNPDFLIVVHVGKEQKLNSTNWGYDYGPYGGYWGGYWGPGGVSTYQYEEGSLILDFVDTKSKKLIWRGVVKAEVQNADTPEKIDTLINDAVREILKKYPPSSSK